jgi:aminomethyltransferase
MTATTQRRSPLHEHHVALGAKTAPFGGWEMPLEYAGGGVLKEHAAVRSAVGVFDVSHLGTLRVTGPGAASHVDACLTNALSRIGPGRAQYTLACDDVTGGVVDDLIVYLFADDDLLLVPNAANSAEVARRLAAGAPAGVDVVDLHAEQAILAVQGPASDGVLERLGLPAGHPYMSFRTGQVDAASVVVCRSGYTGERGYELILDSAAASRVWEDLLEAGQEQAIRPCGLAARDTLRTEMGYPLHGQDLGPDITPLQGRVGWAVGWDKPAFWGREVLLAERESKPRRLLRGLRAVGRGIPRPGMPVAAADDDAGGRALGLVTSGTFSPTLRTGIGLALLDRAVVDGDEVVVEMRGRSERFQVTKPPFVTTSTG